VHAQCNRQCPNSCSRSRRRIILSPASQSTIFQIGARDSQRRAVQACLSYHLFGDWGGHFFRRTADQQGPAKDRPRDGPRTAPLYRTASCTPDIREPRRPTALGHARRLVYKRTSACVLAVVLVWSCIQFPEPGRGDCFGSGRNQWPCYIGQILTFSLRQLTFSLSSPTISRTSCSISSLPPVALKNRNCQRGGTSSSDRSRRIEIRLAS
jgi:hypothetical protein